MGSTMKPTIFNERVAKALKNWHQTAKKHLKQNEQSRHGTPTPSQPSTPLHHGMSPVYLLHNYKSEVDSYQNSPRHSSLDRENWEGDGAPTDVQWANQGQWNNERDTSVTQPTCAQHRIDVLPGDFSFDKRDRIWFCSRCWRKSCIICCSSFFFLFSLCFLALLNMLDYILQSDKC